jgi:hypothetical protein
MRKVFVLMMALSIITPALAQLYTYEFSGYVSQITNQNNAIPGVYLNQPFTGTFSYSSMPFSTTGIYDQPASLTIKLGTFTLTHTDKQTAITVINNLTSATGKVDSFTFHASGTQGLYTYTRSGVTLQDSTRTAFTTTALPETLLLSAFNSAKMNLTGSKGTDTFNIIGNITTLTLIPEPATLLMLAAAIPFLRRKR